jgi:Spy/CpxP family protein refolding chaperone
MKSKMRLIWVLSGVGLLAQVAWAQVPLKDLTAAKWWTNRRIIQELKLSPEQQTKIDAVFLQSRKNLVERKAEFDRRQAELAAMLAKDTSDEAAVVKAFEEVQQARVSLERTTFLMRLQIKNLLTAEQQPKIEEIAERLRQQRPAASSAPATPSTAPVSVKKSGR